MKKISLFKKLACAVLALALILLAIPTMEAKAATDVKVHFKNTQGWESVYAYTWGEGDLFGGWPGTDITATADAEGYYTATLTAYPGTALNIIFNNGNGSQTADLVCGISQSAEWWVVPKEDGWACTVATSKADAEAGKATEVVIKDKWIPENPTIKESPVIDGNTVTFYFESEIAEKVEVFGSMNGWASGYVMEKNGNVFSYTCTLDAGTYEYKYVINVDSWITDPFNDATVQNGNNTNSTFTVTATGSTSGDSESTAPEDTKPEDTTSESTTPEDTNTEEGTTEEPTTDVVEPTITLSPVINGNEVTFYFEHATANKVVVAGSMNGWSTTEWTMTKEEGTRVFSYTVTIAEAGTYQYKYVVDDAWITDPCNQNTVDDGAGNINSVFEIAQSVEVPETEDSANSEVTSEVTTEDNSKEDASDEKDTQTTEVDKDATPAEGNPMAIMIAIAVILILAIGGLAGFIVFKIKKNN